MRTSTLIFLMGTMLLMENGGQGAAVSDRVHATTYYEDRRTDRVIGAGGVAGQGAAVSGRDAISGRVPGQGAAMPGRVTSNGGVPGHEVLYENNPENVIETKHHRIEFTGNVLNKPIYTTTYYEDRRPVGVTGTGGVAGQGAAVSGRDAISGRVPGQGAAVSGRDAISGRVPGQGAAMPGRATSNGGVPGHEVLYENNPENVIGTKHHQISFTGKVLDKPIYTSTYYEDRRPVGVTGTGGVEGQGAAVPVRAANSGGVPGHEFVYENRPNPENVIGTKQHRMPTRGQGLDRIVYANNYYVNGKLATVEK